MTFRLSEASLPATSIGGFSPRFGVRWAASAEFSFLPPKSLPQAYAYCSLRLFTVYTSLFLIFVLLLPHHVRSGTLTLVHYAFRTGSSGARGLGGSPVKCVKIRQTSNRPARNRHRRPVRSSSLGLRELPQRYLPDYVCATRGRDAFPGKRLTLLKDPERHCSQCHPIVRHHSSSCVLDAR